MSARAEIPLLALGKAKPGGETVTPGLSTSSTQSRPSRRHGLSTHAGAPAARSGHRGAGEAATRSIGSAAPWFAGYCIAFCYYHERAPRRRPDGSRGGRGKPLGDPPVGAPPPRRLTAK